MVGRRRILLVEDEQSIVGPLVEALGREGFDAEVAGTAAEALAADGDFDLVLLDIGLPDGSGLDVCRELRAQSSVPIVMLTARGDETDRVVGLELGADDYVVKPFSARELVARIRAVLRRADERRPEPAGSLVVGDVRLDPARRTAERDGRPLSLTRKEFELLEALMRSAGTVVSRDQLFEQVWGTRWFGSAKTLDVHVRGLRRALDDDPAEPRYIHTVRGIGFRFAGEDEL